MATTTTYRAKLRGGPHENVGEIERTFGQELPQVLTFGQSHEWVYQLTKVDHTKHKALYDYAPRLSVGHTAAVRADVEAVREVAEREGVPVEQVLARARLLASTRSNDSPAKLLLDEAQRRGVDPAVLILEHEDRLSEGAPGVI